jgi:histone H3/H4
MAPSTEKAALGQKRHAMHSKKHNLNTSLSKQRLSCATSRVGIKRVTEKAQEELEQLIKEYICRLGRRAVCVTEGRTRSGRSRVVVSTGDVVYCGPRIYGNMERMTAKERNSLLFPRKHSGSKSGSAEKKEADTGAAGAADSVDKDANEDADVDADADEDAADTASETEDEDGNDATAPAATSDSKTPAAKKKKQDK